MNFIFLFDFTAPYLPWVMLSFSLFLQKDLLPDILGILVGHLYYFLEDVYPRMTRPPIRLLRTPRLIQLLFAPDIAVPVAQAAPAGDIDAAANIINADAAELNAEDDDDDDD